jgi:hypothetical protein
MTDQAKMFSPIQAIALNSLARKVNGPKAYTDRNGNPCSARSLVDPGEYHGEFVPGIGFGLIIGDPKPGKRNISWAKLAPLFINRTNDQTIAAIVKLATDGRYESITDAKSELLEPLRTPTLQDARLKTKYLRVSEVSQITTRRSRIG